MRSRIISHVPALTITAALALTGCAVEDDAVTSDDLSTESAELSAAANLNLNLYVTKENQGCDFGIARYELTAHATGTPSITWYVKDWDGSYFQDGVGPTYPFKGAAGHRKYFKVTACVAGGCDVEMYSFVPECKPAD